MGHVLLQFEFMSHSIVDVTIIGGGPVGLFAAFYAGQRGMSARIIDSLRELGGQLMALYPEKYIYDMPGFPKVLAKDLASAMADQGTQFAPEVVLDETATGIELIDGAYHLLTSKGNTFPTRTVIISAGAGAFSPTKIGVDRESDFEGKGIYYGVKQLSVFEGKRVAIVGGGDSAMDWCLALHPIVKSLTLIHRRDQFRAHEDSVEKVFSLPIEKKLWCGVAELHGSDTLEAITIKNSQTQESEQIELDALVVNIGFKSSLGPLKDWGFAVEKNQIPVTPPSFETSMSNVFAVGDVCTYEGKLKLIATGVGEAVSAICVAKTRLDPDAKLFPGHSSDRD